MVSNPLLGRNSVHWLKWKEPWLRSFCSGDPDVITWSYQPIWLQNTHSQIGQHVTSRLTCLTPRQDCVTLTVLLGMSLADPSRLTWPCYFSTSKRRELCREACQDTQTSIRLASYLVREPNSRSGGHEFGRELSALTKVERSWWSDLSTISSICDCNSQFGFRELAMQHMNYPSQFFRKPCFSLPLSWG